MSRLGEILTDTDPPVHAIIMWNVNPLVSVPNAELIKRGMVRDTFTIVHEQFTPTRRNMPTMYSCNDTNRAGRHHPIVGASLSRLERACDRSARRVGVKPRVFPSALRGDGSYRAIAVR